jgi:hypothetical protein
VLVVFLVFVLLPKKNGCALAVRSGKQEEGQEYGCMQVTAAATKYI